MQKILGEPLTHLSNRIRRKVFHDCGGQLGKLLGGSFRDYGWVDPEKKSGTFENWSTFLISFVDRYGSTLISDGILTDRQVRRLKIKLGSLPTVKPTLIHRDLKPSNLLAKGGCLSGILDWENAIIGDGLFDLAVLIARLGLDSKDAAAARRGYEGKAGSVDDEKLNVYVPVVLIGEIAFRRRRGHPFSTYARRLLIAINKIR